MASACSCAPRILHIVHDNPGIPPDSDPYVSDRSCQRPVVSCSIRNTPLQLPCVLSAGPDHFPHIYAEWYGSCCSRWFPVRVLLPPEGLPPESRRRSIHCVCMAALRKRILPWRSLFLSRSWTVLPRKWAPPRRTALPKKVVETVSM